MSVSLENSQKIAYRVLENAIKNDQLSHAYLFVGEKGTSKKKMAFHVAKSLVCERGEIACNECTMCHRIDELLYSDLLFFDGAKQSIKKEDVLKIQEIFYKTALEKNGYKIFIMNEVEAATVEALNSLLKFLEEPSNNVIAILTTQSLDKVLPTIVSRCQVVQFHKQHPDVVYEDCKNEVEYLEDAYYLAQNINDAKEIVECSESDEYQSAKYLFEKTYLLYGKDYEEMLFVLQTQGFQKKKTNDKDVLKYYFLLIKSMLKLKLHGKKTMIKEVDRVLDTLDLKKEEIIRMLLIVAESEDRIRKSTNASLLLDAFVYQLKEGE